MTKKLIISTLLLYQYSCSRKTDCDYIQDSDAQIVINSAFSYTYKLHSNEFIVHYLTKSDTLIYHLTDNEQSIINKNIEKLYCLAKLDLESRDTIITFLCKHDTGFPDLRDKLHLQFSNKFVTYEINSNCENFQNNRENKIKECVDIIIKTISGNSEVKKIPTSDRMYY